MKKTIGLVAAFALTACNFDSNEEAAPQQSNEVMIPFSMTVNDRPASCGESYSGLSLSSATLELRDLRFFVHDVRLVQDDGLEVKVNLEADYRWQTDRLALLDFTSDDSNACADRGTSGTRAFLKGQADISKPTEKLRFKVGVPPELNHLNAPSLEAPLNEPGMWWSWAGGFRFFKADFISQTRETNVERYSLHTGAVGCTAESIEGPYKCANDMIAEVEIDFNLNEDQVNIDLGRILSSFDLNTGRGCMGASNLGLGPDSTGFKPCDAVYEAFGITLNPNLSAPEQVAFRSQTYAGSLDLSIETADLSDTRNPSHWPHPDYQRPPSLDITLSSQSTSKRSHALGDPRFGENCLRCHQIQGPGPGRFVVGGTLIWDDGSEYDAGGFVEIGSGDGAWGELDPEKKLQNFAVALRLPIDGNGNFYATENEGVDYQSQSYQARVVDNNGRVLLAMAPKKVGACNSCHNGSFSITVPKSLF
ncbi:MbnP family copper-binding protein [Pseudobacteriovorax antillogorgiicola]|uniref:AZL_007920/MXAN_0976 family protein n=1 Tax=Pseudobacteriovorax antillogorgiicola TaxID=1513793 RepID=A0A1Y6CW27_9BACT|nr:MbnP family copper-binding protein [Pseudobacteriovorax antillogorgiicola]TCS42861.1 putative repeat protein (TIGR04052 family) [Pseudobacteriovorax antillogorgiicola]SMF81998.1 AZL_007920/MXAN_0976 family protein [Pseudobacteriovorax antillogorgiicola]